MTNKQIAATIVAQMGGMNRLTALVNARGWIAIDKGLQFTFSGKRGMNKCLVKLTPADTYDVEFWYINARKGTCVKKVEYKDTYEDMLIGLFEKTTGLYLSLGTMGRKDAGRYSK